MLIAWSTQCSTGIAELDNRHKALIWLANGLNDAYTAGNNPETLGMVLSIFAEYADFHFTRGRQLMKERRCLHRHEYDALHDELVERLGTFVFRFETGTVGVSADTLAFLHEWLTRLMAFDQHFGRALAAAAP